MVVSGVKAQFFLGPTDGSSGRLSAAPLGVDSTFFLQLIFSESVHYFSLEAG